MENVVTPFNLSTNSVWLIQIVLPTLITVIGWVSVFLLNKQNMKSERKTVVKIESYYKLSERLDTLIRDLGTFNNFIFNTYNVLGRFQSDSPSYDSDKNLLFQNFKEDKFRALYESAGNSFVDFIFVWEQFEIVFKPLVKQRYALNEEFTELSSFETELWSEYNSVLTMFFNVGVPIGDIGRTRIVDSMMRLFLKYLDFMCCLTDLRNNLQNFVFSKTLGESNSKRIVKDTSMLTIETLIQKHKDKIDKE